MTESSVHGGAAVWICAEPIILVKEKDNKWMNHWLITSKSVNFVSDRLQADDCEAMRLWTNET